MEKKQNEKLALYEKLIQSVPDVELKGASMPYTSLNGHMFSQLSKSGTVGLRLPAEEREKFLTKYNTELFKSYGTVMKEYVAVPDELLEKTAELKTYFELSVEYIKQLKPKPSKKK